MNSNLNEIFHPDLTKDRIHKSILAFAVPMAISFIFQQFYNAVDIVVVGHFLGENSLAAIGATSAIFNLLLGFGNGFGNGLGIVAARAYGAKDENMLKKVVLSSILISIGVSLFIFLICLFFLKKLLFLLADWNLV